MNDRGEDVPEQGRPGERVMGVHAAEFLMRPGFQFGPQGGVDSQEE